MIFFVIENIYTTWNLHKRKKTMSARMIAQLSICFFCWLLHVLQNARRFRSQQSGGWPCQLAGFNIFLKDFLFCNILKKGFSYCWKILEKSRPGKCSPSFHSFSLYMLLYYFQVCLFKFYFWPNCSIPNLVYQLKSAHCAWSGDSDDSAVFTISLSLPSGPSQTPSSYYFTPLKSFLHGLLRAFMLHRKVQSESSCVSTSTAELKIVIRKEVW